MKDLIILVWLIAAIYGGLSLLVYIENKKKSEWWCISEVNSENTHNSLFTRKYKPYWAN